MKRSILLIFSLLSGLSFAGKTQSAAVARDSVPALASREIQLAEYLDALRKAPNDMEKEAANQQFKAFLHETIQLNGAMDYAFSRLRSIGTIKSPDNSFRFFNWNVEQDDETQKYYCYILRFDERKQTYKVIELIDNSMMLPPQPEDVLDENMWYGALYYKIIPTEKSGKTVYTLLGYDANNNMSHTKLIDVMSFSGTHIKLGSPVFKVNGETRKRMFFEHSKKCVMSLNYDEQRRKIIFDHLSPESPSMTGFYEFYVPDMSLDALKFTNNKWVLEEDIIALSRLPEKPSPVYVIDAQKDGQLERHKEPAKWTDPSNPTAPAGQNIHTPALPEETPEDPKVKKNPKEVSEFPPVRKKDKKSKSGVTGITTKKRR